MTHPGYATQNGQVLNHLLNIGPLTPLEALERYGTFRLGARVFDLKAGGHDIQTRMIRRNGKRFAEYFIPLPKGQLEFPVFQPQAAHG